MTDPTIILKLSYIAYSILNIRPLNLVVIKGQYISDTLAMHCILG